MSVPLSTSVLSKINTQFVFLMIIGEKKYHKRTIMIIKYAKKKYVNTIYANQKTQL